MTLRVKIGVCETAGCFRATYDSRLCSKCLDARTPLQRGPVTWSDLVRVRGLRGEDLSVIHEHMLLHGQDPMVLFREGPE